MLFVVFSSMSELYNTAKQQREYVFETGSNYLYDTEFSYSIIGMMFILFGLATEFKTKLKE